MNAQWMGRGAAKRRLTWTGRIGTLALLGVLNACGGGGGDDDGGGGGGGGGGSGNGSWTAGVFQPSSNFADRCVAPRAGTSDRSGTVVDENNFLRSWTNELYLWYSEVPDLNPSLYSSTADYFDRLKTSQTTSSGAAKDRFHFTYSTAEWLALSQSGEEVSYGLQFALLSTTPPRRAVIAFIEPNPPGATQVANLTRGVEVIAVDDVSIDTTTQAGVDTLNNGLFPDTAGEQHRFTIRDLNNSQPRTVTLTAAVVTSDPVPTVSVLPTNSGNVGYILFNDHIGTSELELVNAINQLRAAPGGVQDLVLDLRYNGGGYLDIASELAYMIAGSTPTAGRTFERLQFSDKYPNTNPVTNQALTPTPFYTTGRGFSVSNGTALPTLNLPRVFVLTGNGTCSASESIINGLRGVGVQVIQIGNTTCGKPYGFYPEDNCGTTYFSIQFRGVNAANFGDYADGFVPTTTTPTQQWQLPGCPVSDDFTQALGSLGENRLEAALAYRLNGGQCIALATENSLAAAEGVIPKSPWRTNRILRD